MKILPPPSSVLSTNQSDYLRPFPPEISCRSFANRYFGISGSFGKSGEAAFSTMLNHGRSLVLMLSCFISINSAWAQFSGGSGTSGDPYLISSLNDLVPISGSTTYWTQDLKQTANIDASASATFDDTDDDADGDLFNDAHDAFASGTNNGASPIGMSATKVSGTYDGGDYSISGLKIAGGTTHLVGLSRSTSNATTNAFGSIQPSGKSSSALGSGRSTLQTKSSCTFLMANGDFDGESSNETSNVGMLDANQNNSYPAAPDPPFVTEWAFSASATQLTFNGLTATASVLYTWSARPSGNSGSGAFSSTTPGSVTLSGLTIASGDTLVLSMEPQNLRRFYLDGSADNTKLIDVSQWGSVPWSSMANMFKGCTSLVRFSASDAPDLSTVTDLSNMFYGASSFNDAIDEWETDSVTNMANLFYGASAFNQNIGSWNTAKVTDMSGIFQSAIAFNQSLGSWTLHSSVNLTDMLRVTGMDCTSYSNTLNGWNDNPATPNGLILDAVGLEYGTNASASRNNLITVKGWTINSDMAGSSACSLNPFTTKWAFKAPAPTIYFSAQTTGFVRYTWSAYPSGNSGSGTFSQTTAGEVMLTGFNTVGADTLPIDTITLVMEPQNLRRFYMESRPQRDSIIDVSHWGEVPWSSMEDAFYRCSKLNISATDAPDLTRVTNMSSMFDGATELNVSLSHWNTSSVTNMSGVFYGAFKFNGNLSGWNTGNVTNMSEMFRDAFAFNQNIGSWNTSNVTNMSAMFRDAREFNQNIGSWNTGKVTNMSEMFYFSANTNKFNQNIGSWNTASVTDFSSMFYGTKEFNQNIGSWNTSMATDMHAMFANAAAFNQNIGSWNTANVTDMSAMFSSAIVFNQNIGAWNTGQVTNMSTMFNTAEAFNQNISSWNTANVTDMTSMFKSTLVFNQPIGTWNTGNVTNMRGMFSYTEAFNQNIGSWNTSSVTDMSDMFLYAEVFNQNIGSWNTSNVTDMTLMFSGAVAFNQNIGGWNTAEVTRMGGMFALAEVFNQNISSWNTGKVTLMSQMFLRAFKFNQPIGTWNTANVTDMSLMFEQDSVFNQDISAWNTSKVTNMSSMFKNATSFNQNLEDWDFSIVTNMSQMFYNAAAFNQNIGSWNLASGVNLGSMLDKSGLTCINYSGTLNGWAANASLPTNRSLGVSGLVYGSNGETAHNTLTMPTGAGGKGWTISGDSLGLGSCPCPVLTTAPPNAVIVNSICSPGCQPGGGSIAAPTGTPCPVGAKLQYKVGTGAWSNTLPVYDQDGPAQTIKTRCACDDDGGLVSSPESSGVTTIPGTCLGVTAAITGADTVCLGIQSTLTASGGVSFRWSTGDSTAILNISPIADTSYSVVVTDINGCSDSTSINIVVIPQAPSVNAVSDQTLCAGASTSAISFTGAIPGTQFTWTNTLPSIGLPASGAGNIAAFTAMNPGTSVLSAQIVVSPMLHGCTGMLDTFVIHVKPKPVINPVADRTICPGTTSQPIAFTSNIPGTTFTWTNNNPSIGLSASGVGAIAAFTGQNAGDIPVSAQIVSTPTFNSCIGAPESFNVEVSSVMQIKETIKNTCIGSSTGAIDLLVSGGAGGYTFAWSNNAASEDLVGVPSGVYTVAVEDALGCMISKTFTVTANTPLPTLELSTPEMVCSGGAVLGAFTASEPMQVSYTLNGGLARTTNLQSGFSTLSFGAIQGTMEVRIQTAVSLITGCPAETTSLTKKINTVTVPGLFADNISVCSQDTFTIPVNKTVSDATILFDWVAQYVGVTGGKLSKSGLVAGKDGITERLQNNSALPLNVVYTLKPYTSIGGLTCPGPEYRVRVEVQPLPSLEAVATKQVCSGVPFNIPLRSINAQNPVITWERVAASDTLEGRGNIADVLENTGTTVRAYSYLAQVVSGGCKSIPVDVTVQVQPALELLLNVPSTICSGVLDLTSPDFTIGSNPSLILSYWKDAALRTPVDNPKQAPAGLYFVAARNALGCTTIKPLPIPATFRLRVTPPAPICAGGTANLMAPAITAGSEPGLALSYWYDLEATRPVLNPAVVPTGQYYIKAEQPGNPNCYAIEQVEVRALLPRLLNNTAIAEVCSGSTFTFVPEVNVSEYTFEWSRATQTGISNPAISGQTSIAESLLSTSNTPVLVQYTYRLKATGCSLLGTEMDTIQVMVLPLPEFTVQDSSVVCSATTNLQALVSNPGAYLLQFNYASGKGAVLNPVQALHGRYMVTAQTEKGCARTQPLTVFSSLAAPLSLDTILEICPPALANLSSFTSNSGLAGRFVVRYYQDVEVSKEVDMPSAVGEGTYYIQLRGKQSNNATCTTILPLQVKLGIASMDSPLELEQHCGGTIFSYIPSSTQQGVSFSWELLPFNRPDTLRGTEAISVLLSNVTDSVQYARFRIVATRNLCVKQLSSSYLLDVEVLPRPAIALLVPQESNSGDSLLVDVLLTQAIASARLNWVADYTGLLGGKGSAVGVPFGTHALTDQLFNFNTTPGSARYTLIPILPGTQFTCAGDTATLEVVVREYSPEPASIAGAIATKLGAGIEGVELNLSGPQFPGISKQTNSGGLFDMTTLRAGYDYSLQPLLDDYPLNGVSTRDLIILQQHLLGVKVLQDPFKRIAADVNASQSITVADLIALKRVILGIDARFKNNTSWRFLPADYSFPDPLQPWTPAFPELLNFNDLEGNVEADFTGIKIGDLSGDAKANRSAVGTVRSSEAWQVSTINKEVLKNEQFILPFQFTGSEALEGMQFTVVFDSRALRLRIPESTFTDSESVGIVDQNGWITISISKSIQPGDVLMYLAFEAIHSGQTRYLIDINSRITIAEGYQGDQTYPIELTFLTADMPDERPRAMQNYPNPFSGRTTIPFWHPDADRVWLKVFDLTGRLVFTRSMWCARGLHTFELTSDELPVGNAWYYQVGGTGWAETKFMNRF